MSKDTNKLNSTIENLVSIINGQGGSVSAEELNKLVKSHAAGASASMIASGAIPGVGSTIAAGIEIGFVWSMYYRICGRLNIDIRKNVLKTLGSAIVTNMGASVAAQIITGTVLSIIPGIGTVGAAMVNGLMGYSLTYYSGIVFMQLLVRVFKAGKNVTQMSEDELKSTLVDVTKEVTYDSVKDESKKAFKNRKNDKKATAIEEDDTIQVLKPDCTYWLHTGIDFGSTNSVMAWRLYKWSDEDDSWLLDEDYNKENNIIRCPTMLIYKKDNLLHPVVQAEPEDVIIGKRAEELADDSQEPAIAKTNFKPQFYDAPAGSAERKVAEELIRAFMTHLNMLYQSEIVACLPNSIAEDMNCTVHFSTPVRAGKEHRDFMVSAAMAAGFRNDGQHHFIDTSRNEAECVMQLCVDENMSNMEKLMRMSYSKSALNLLFIDVGGSTTDIELIKQELHSASKSTQVLAMWPREKVQYMLGGCEVDRAIYEYLLDKECLVPRFANECWENGAGKALFRKLKENNNEILRAGKEINSIGTIKTACGDPDEEEFPRNKYKDHRITREIFENEICGRYINDLCKAVHDILQGLIGEEDVDAVFLTGAGSRLYFIHDLILGRHGDDPLKLTQLQQDENRLFDGHADPAACCALGAISNVM